jgi:Protein of unknown function (DUF1091)
MITGNRKLQLLNLPKTDYCKLREQLERVPVLSNIFGNLLNNRNIFLACPTKPGRYQLPDIPIDQLMKVTFPKGLYRLIFEVSDEVAKPVTFVKVMIDDLCN